MIFDLILLDQGTKWVARNYWETPVDVFSFFSLRFVENEGIAFSMPVAQYILIPFTIVVMAWLGFEMYKIYNKKQKNYYQQYAYALIFAGAVGNLIDRLIYGKVTDFLSFWNFPIFNLADTWITIGVGLFIYSEFTQSQKKTP